MNWLGTVIAVPLALVAIGLALKALRHGRRAEDLAKEARRLVEDCGDTP